VADKLKTAVIGVGYLGRHHARIYSKLPGVELAAVADSDRESAERIADMYAARPFTDYRELPDDVAAVSVATPTVTHFEIASYFLEKGVPVLVEKPMTATLDEALELDRIARDSGTLLQVGHIERFNPAMMAVRDLDIQPKFIESHRLAPFKFRSVDVGVVMDLMIHDIDIILDLCRGPVKKVDAVGGAILSQTEDLANARIEFESGCVANVTASRVSFKSLRRTRVFSGDSFISIDYEKKYALLAKKSPDLDMNRVDLSSIDPTRFEDLQKLLMNDLIKVKELKLDEYEPLQKELGSFVQSVREGSEPVVPAAHGVRAIRLAFDILASIEGHRW